MCPESFFMHLPHSFAHLPSSAGQVPAESHSLQEAVQWQREAGRRPGFLSPLCPLLCDLRKITPPLWALVSLFVKGVGWIGFLSAGTHYGRFYRVKSDTIPFVSTLSHPIFANKCQGLSVIEFNPYTWEGQRCISKQVGHEDMWMLSRIVLNVFCPHFL